MIVAPSVPTWPKEPVGRNRIKSHEKGLNIYSYYFGHLPVRRYWLLEHGRKAMEDGGAIERPKRNY